MLESSVSKCEKTPWLRARRWLGYFMLILIIGTSILIIYSFNMQVPWSLNIWTIRSQSNMTTSVSNVTDSREAGADGGEEAREGRGREEGGGIEREAGADEGREAGGDEGREAGGDRGGEAGGDVGGEAEREAGNSQISPADPSSSKYFVAYPHQYHFILDEPNRCRQESPFLVLMIPVPPHNREARDTIRNTWGKEVSVLGRSVSHYFLLGMSKEEDETELLKEQVLEESQRHHDILQSNFLDSYNNLTIKTMVIFEWLDSHCPNTFYAMKIDSDMFLNVHKLVDMLSTARQNLYMTGLVARHAAVFRDYNSKWFLPFSAFPESTYPPYALGLGYVFSLDVAKKILEASKHVKAIYIEDVYVGLCMRYLGIAHTDPPHGGLFRATIPGSTTKCYWTSVITTILHSSNQLSEIWKTYQTQVQSGC